MFPWIIPAGERRLAGALGGYLFLVVCALYLMKPARNAVFLEGLGANNLPYVYIATAIVTWWVVIAYVRVTNTANLQRIVRGTLIASVVAALGFWVWLRFSVDAAAAVFYIWVKIYAVLLPSQFWLLSEELLDPRQARRLFGPIGAGGILGGIIGSASSVVIASVLGASSLLPFAAAVMFAALVLFHFVLASMPGSHTPSPGRTVATPETDLGPEESTAPMPHGTALVVTIAAILVVANTAHTVVDWQFNKAAEMIPTQDGTAAFFGTFFTVLNIVTLAIQMLATSFVLRYFGIGVAMAMLPIAIASGALGILVYPGLLTATLARGADDSLRLSIDQSGRELLFLPFSSEDRRRLKPRIDLIASRAATGAAGVVILVAIWLLDDPLRYLSIFSLFLAAVWAGLIFRARQQYTHTLQHLLRVHDLDTSNLAQSRLDADASAAIRDGLDSDDPETVHAALALAEHTDPTAFVEELRALLQSTDDDLRGHALRLLAASDGEADVEEALNSMRGGDDSSAAEVLAHACVTRDPEARERIFQYLEGSDAMLSPEVLRPTLTALLRDDNPQVALGALAACRRFPDAALVPAICEAGARRHAEGAALQTLQAFGRESVGALTGVLANPAHGRPLRSFAARALGRVGGAEAAEGLTAGLVAEDRNVRRAALKALNYMRRRGEPLHIGREREAAAIGIEWADYLSLHRLAAALGEPGTGSSTAFVATVVSERLWEAEEQLFRALALRHPIQAVFFAYRGLITGDAAARSHAIELVDSVIETPERRTLVRLLESGDRLDRGNIAAQELGRAIPTSAEALQELLSPGDPWLAACVVRALPAGSDDVGHGLGQELRAQQYRPLNEVLGT